MLTIPGGRQFRMCDGFSRRSFLQVGGLAMGGLSLPQLLQAESQQGRKSHKAVIMIFLSGGPPHQDMVDLKPAAPAEYRGEFKPIHTNVPGIEICEHLPLLAQRMDRMVTIRSLVGSEGRHAAFQCNTGHAVRQQPPGGWPAFGAAVSKLQGPVNRDTPAFVNLSPKMKSRTWADPGQAGFAGMAHAPFAPNASGSSGLTLQGLTLESLRSRRELAHQLDGLKRLIDQNDVLDGMNTYYQQAFDILTSGKLAEALDVERADPKLRRRYGLGSSEPAGYGDAGPLLNDYLLVARRLVEAGARVVSLAYGRWDWHGRPHGTNFENARDHLPVLDQGVAALLDDLRDRGLDQDVSVIVWGEFGRTPKINPKGGRDHWPRVACALMSGGGMRTGQVIGATNALAEYAVARPVHFEEVFATLYHNMGINTEHVTLPDLGGRPTYLVDHGKYPPLPEVV
ncbi:MAG: DUF1501 domain-containing protein [Planctomycetota bacterium]|nr:DUF1501 domain-containing protein [Planctomycetota bacterium]